MDWSIFFQGIMAIGVIAFSIGQFVTGKKEVKIADVDNANSTVRLFKDRADLLEKDLSKRNVIQRRSVLMFFCNEFPFPLWNYLTYQDP